MRRTWIGLLATLGLGCFIDDELDRGGELMEQLGPGKRAAKAQPARPAEAARAAPQGSEGPGLLERLGTWWDAATEPAPPPPDPSDAPVACALGGSITFMRARDCEVRGGSARPRGGSGSAGG